MPIKRDLGTRNFQSATEQPTLSGTHHCKRYYHHHDRNRTNRHRWYPNNYHRVRKTDCRLQRSKSIIKQERADKPTLKVWRIDLFDVAAEDFLSYAQNFQGQDSLNSEGGIGWYSILSTDLYSKLLGLMASLNNSSMIVAR